MGYTMRVFLAQLAQNAGYRLDFSCVDADELMIATIYAAQGIDLPLKDVLDHIVPRRGCLSGGCFAQVRGFYCWSVAGLRNFCYTGANKTGQGRTTRWSRTSN